MLPGQNFLKFFLLKMEELIISQIESVGTELKAEIQYVHDELKGLRTDLANVEQVTAKNWLDIPKLNAIR